MNEIREFSSLDEYIDTLQSQGHYLFTRSSMLQSVKLSLSGLHKAIRRLEQKARLVVLHREVYFIVPLEYRAVGLAPPPWFIDGLMKTLQRPYYVGLLSAALYHGAAHQQPQVFQVMTQTPFRSIHAGRVKVDFFVKQTLQVTPTQELKTEIGTMRVSTPEATAIDLVRYAHQAGGLAHVGLVLAELQEKMTIPGLKEALAPEVEVPVLQRLGYLLEQINNATLVTVVLKKLQSCPLRFIPLVPKDSAYAGKRNKKFHIIENTILDLEDAT